MLQMKQKNIFLIAFALLISLSTSSCIYFIAGGVGALGGYAISPDTVEGDSELDYDTLWDSAIEITSIMGIIHTKDYKLGTLQATVSGAAITVDISQISSNEVRMRVKARKNMLPNIKIAQDVFVKIKNGARQ